MTSAVDVRLPNRTGLVSEYARLRCPV